MVKKYSKLGYYLTFFLIAIAAAFYFRKFPNVVYSGIVADDFSLMTHDGRLMTLSQPKEKKAIVLASFQLGCPIVRKSIPQFVALSKKYQKEADFFYIDSSLQDTREKLINEAKEYQLPIPILIDGSQEVARQLDIDRTGEILLIEAGTRKIIYRGPLSDQLGYGIDTGVIKNNFFEDALHSFLANKPLAPSSKKALGCAITFENEPAPSYYGGIDKIIAQKCLSCHNLENGLPPTNLNTYSDLKNWSKMIKEVLLTEKMPPWEVDTHITPLRDSFELTNFEKRQIYSWIRNGYPEGSLSKKLSDPKKKQEPRFIGNLILPMTEEVKISADTQSPWHYEQIMGETTEDLWINSVDFKITNRKVIQHMALLVLKQKLDLSKNLFEPQFEAPKNISNLIRWSAQVNQRVDLTKDNGKLYYKIPKHSYVYLELHFSKSGKDESTQVTTYLQTQKYDPNKSEIKYFPLAADASTFRIPPKVDPFMVTRTIRIPNEMHAFRVGGHMHWRGKSVRLFKLNEDKSKELLFSSRYIFKNRRTWHLDKPIHLKSGTQLEVQFEFDNTRFNPANIDETQTVRWGSDAYLNEMGVLHFIYY